MPFRKEVKEAVVYPASKRKAPPFKPQRPNKVIRTTTATSDASDNGQSVSRTSTAASRSNSMSTMQDPVVSKPKDRAVLDVAAPKSAEFISNSDESEDDDSDDLPDNPLSKPASKVIPPQKKTASKTTASRTGTGNDKTILEPDAMPPDIDQNATIPQRLLLRLLHENFTSQSTKIDKHAIAALQQYVDLFVRETVARAALAKKDDADNGQASQTEVNWLEREDLEKVAGGMLMDF